jgi:polygalacturonase
MSSPNLERALRIKSNSHRGGIVEHIYMRNVTVGDVSDAVVRINMFYANETGDNHPQVRNVQVSNVTSKKSVYGLRIEGEEDYPVENITIENCSFDNVSKGNILTGVKDLKLKKVNVNGKSIKSKSK